MDSHETPTNPCQTLNGCLECKHLQFHEPEPGYSSWTPSVPGRWMCDRGHYASFEDRLTIEGLRSVLDCGRNCPDFELKEPQNG